MGLSRACKAGLQQHDERKDASRLATLALSIGAYRIPGVSICTNALTNVAESPDGPQIATIAEGMPGSLKLCYGESDMPTPEFICQAAHEAALAGHTFYTHTAGYPELREAIADKIFELHQRRVRARRRSWPRSARRWPSTRRSGRWSAEATTPIVISPAYAIFSNGVIMSGGEPRPVPLARRRRRVRSSISIGCARPSTAQHPNADRQQPVESHGWMITEDEQRALVEIADRHDLVLLADEVYERLIYDRERRGAVVRARRDQPRPPDRRQQLLEDLQHDRLAPGLGADERSHHQDHVQGRGVHDLEPRRHGAAGGHRRAPRRRAIHRGAARALRATPRTR